MKLEIQKISVKNFLSVGSQPILLTYEKGIHKVSGSIEGTSIRNGVGKSLLFIDALVFAFYGKSIRDLNLEEMINAINGKECLVIVWFKLNNIEYRLERGLKPGIFELYKEDIKQDKIGSKPKAQKELEYILGISYKSFINMITLNINSSQPFFKMSSSDKRQLLEDILNLSVYGDMFEYIKKSYNDSKNNKKVLTTEFTSLVEIYKNKLDTYKKIKEHKETFEKTKKEKLNELNEKLNTQEVKKSSLLIENIDYNKKIDDLDDELTSLNTKNTEILTNIKRNIKDKEENETKLNNLTKTPICPICNTPTNDSHVEEFKTELKVKIINLTTSITHMEKESKIISNKIKSISSNKTSIKEKINDQNKIKKEYDKLLIEIENTHKEIKEVESSSFIMTDVVTKEEVIKAKSIATIKKEELNKESENMKYAERLKNILGDKGIKNYIIRKILPILNKKMNEYLSVMNANYTIKFDEELNETLKHRNCNVFTYNNFSSGERKRLDLALMFTLIEISKLRRSIDCNILVLDEVLDSSLCADGTELFLNFMKNGFKNNYPDLCTYVITHNSNITENFFDSIIELKKVNSFTKLHNIKK